jgi:hypothetical protein
MKPNPMICPFCPDFAIFICICVSMCPCVPACLNDNGVNSSHRIVIDPLDDLLCVPILSERLIVENACIDASHIDDVAVALYELQERFRAFVGDEIGLVDDGLDGDGDLAVNLNLLSQMFPSLDLSVISSVCSAFPSGSADKIVSCLLDMSDDASMATTDDGSSSYAAPVAVVGGDRMRELDDGKDAKIEEEILLLHHYLPSLSMDEVQSLYDAYDGDLESIVRDIGEQDASMDSSRKRSKQRKSKRGHRRKEVTETISLGDFKRITKEEEEKKKKKKKKNCGIMEIMEIVPETPTWVEHCDDSTSSSSTRTTEAEAASNLSMSDRLMIWDMQTHYACRVPDSVIQHVVISCKGDRNEVVKELSSISGIRYETKQQSVSQKKSEMKKTTRDVRFPAPRVPSFSMHRTSSTISAGVVLPSHGNLKKFLKLLEDRASINIDLMRIRNQHGHVHALDIKDRVRLFPINNLSMLTCGFVV